MKKILQLQFLVLFVVVCAHAQTRVDREKIYRELYDYMTALPKVDTHEHLNQEDVHCATDYNFFYWFIPYVQFDLMAAGMPAEYVWRVPNTDSLTRVYWNGIAPVWNYVKHGAYAHTVLMALKEFYSIDDITPENYMEIGRKMNETRYPGRFKEILQDRCNIKYILNQNGRFSHPDYPYMKGSLILVNIVVTDELRKYKVRNPNHTVHDYLAYMREMFAQAKNEGAVLAKFDASCFVSLPDREAAEREFAAFGPQSQFNNTSLLGGYLFDRMIDMAVEQDMVVCIHTGVWGNINFKNPELLYPVVERHPEATFDIYHAGMPYVHECGFLGKNYPNVYLSLTWSHIVSPRMTVEALDQWLDYIPTNKIFAFGGDMLNMTEMVWAHLEIAKKNLAEVFTRKIERGTLTMEESKQILKMWFYDNPVRVYKLNS